MRRAGPVRSAAFAAAAFLGATFLVYRDVRDGPGAVTLALAAEDVEPVLSASGYPREDFWARARAIGAGAVLTYPATLGSLGERGRIVRFTRAEAEKWAWTGLLAPGISLRPDSLWMRSPELFGQVRRAFLAAGLAVSTQAEGGIYALQPPQGLALDDFSIGADPWERSVYRGLGLTVICRVSSPRELRLLEAGRNRGDGEVLPLFVPPEPGGIDRAAAGAIGGLEPCRGALFEGGRGELPCDARGGVPPPAREVPVGAGMAAVWRAVFGSGSRLLVLRLAPGSGVEESLDAVRRLAAALRSKGFELGISIGERPTEPYGEGMPHSGSAGERPATGVRWEAAARAASLLALGLLVPLLSIRQALNGVRGARCRRFWPEASPVLEIAWGLSCSFLAAVAAGVAVHRLAAFPERTLGSAPILWSAWVHAVPSLLSVLSLYGAELTSWPGFLRRPMRYSGFLKLVCAAALLAALVRGGFPDIWLPESLWWLPGRWREIFVGVPCLTAGLWAHLRRLDELGRSPDGLSRVDSRPWLLLGLLGPAGSVCAFGLFHAPVWNLLLQTGAAWLGGVMLGAAGVAALSTLRARPRKCRGPRAR